MITTLRPEVYQNFAAVTSNIVASGIRRDDTRPDPVRGEPVIINDGLAVINAVPQLRQGAEDRAYADLSCDDYLSEEVNVDRRSGAMHRAFVLPPAAWEPRVSGIHVVAMSTAETNVAHFTLIGGVVSGHVGRLSWVHDPTCTERRVDYVPRTPAGELGVRAGSQPSSPGPLTSLATPPTSADLVDRLVCSMATDSSKDHHAERGRVLAEVDLRTVAASAKDRSAHRGIRHVRRQHTPEGQRSSPRRQPTTTCLRAVR
jgi:hypothetical protein